MVSDMYSIEDMVSKAISHKATLSSYRKDVRDNSIMIAEKSERLKNLSELNRITRWSCNYLDVLIKEESGKFIQRLNDMLDYWVKTIFFDCDYSVEIRVSDNDKATIHLVYDDADGNKLEPDVRDCGGGIRTCIGCLLQIHYIYYYRVEPIIFIDEGLSQLSSTYVPSFLGLVEELAKKNGLRIVLITHDSRFLSYADKRYEVKNGTVTVLGKEDMEEVESGSDSSSVE